MVSEMFRRMRERWEYPYVHTIDSYNAGSCHFEVSNGTEEWLVASLDDDNEFLAKFLFETVSDNVVYDFGENIGSFSVHATKKSARAYSFETGNTNSAYLECRSIYQSCEPQLH